VSASAAAAEVLACGEGRAGAGGNNSLITSGRSFNTIVANFSGVSPKQVLCGLHPINARMNSISAAFLLVPTKGRLRQHMAKDNTSTPRSISDAVILFRSTFKFSNFFLAGIKLA
jgi:hypothetical protein